MRVWWSLPAVLTVVGRLAAATIDVVPGPGTPLQDAIAAANPRDRIRIQPGTYGEAIVVDKPLRLAGVDQSGVIIDAGCTASTAVELASDVSIENLTVIGGVTIQVEALHSDHVSIKDLVMREVCGGTHYGINIETSTHVTLRRNAINDFGAAEAAIYVGQIAAGGRILVQKNVSSRNGGGILIENSVGGGVIAKSNVIVDNDYAVVVQGSTGQLVVGNTITRTIAPYGGVGIWVKSDDNRILRNTISGYPNDVLDDGAGNCWRNNRFMTGTVAACP